MMLASIDVGSNTVRLLLGSVDNDIVVPHRYVRRITRLKGGQTTRGFTPVAMARTLIALKEFSIILSQHQPSSVRIVGTEALRSAVNAGEFCTQVLHETGLNIDIIDGSEEALLTATGVLSCISTAADSVLIFDIGGGSTEFVLVYQGEILFQKSYRLGVVDLAEMFPHSDNRLEQIQATITLLKDEIEPIMQQFAIPENSLVLVGTAGTATTLAAMDMQMVEYDWRRVNGYTLNIATIKAMYRTLDGLTIAERELLPGMEKGRGDLIPAGIEITLEIMQQLLTEKLTISDFGLLEGIMLKMPQFSGAKR